MGKKLQRVFRDRPLTSAEAAEDRDVREKVQSEFPPIRKQSQINSPLTELLRRSIHDSGKTAETIAADSGVPAVLIAGFLLGQRDIHLTTADKLARALGLEVTAD